MLMLILCLSLFLGGCEEVKDVNIEDTNPTVEVQNEEISEDVAIVKAEVEKAVEGMEGFEVTTEGKTVKLTYYMTKEEAEYAIENGDWNEMVEDAVKMANNLIDAMEVEENGDYFDNVTFNFMWGDTDKNEYYLTIVDREIVYNYADEFNNEEVVEETTEESIIVEEKEVTFEQEQALKKAQSYVDTLDYSENDLRKQLEYHGFSEEAIQYALDNVKVDYQQECIDKAESYLEIFSYSENDLRKQLEYHGFSEEHIEKAIQETYK